MLYIGIDPGVHTGIAIWNKAKGTLENMFTGDFWDVLELLGQFKVKNPSPFHVSSAVKLNLEAKVIIEDPGLNKPVFVKKGANSHAAIQKVAQNVGMNKAYAKLIIEFCVKYGIKYEAVRPTTAKWDDNYFKKITRMDKNLRVSQHVRDAVKLVWGM